MFGLNTPAELEFELELWAALESEAELAGCELMATELATCELGVTALDAATELFGKATWELIPVLAFDTPGIFWAADEPGDSTEALLCSTVALLWPRLLQLCALEFTA